MSAAATTRAGVIGVGSMGQNHARVYAELPDVELVGVADTDEKRANEVATRHDTDARARADLLATVDVVSIAVPTAYHYDLARECIEADVAVLVEKPFVADPENGRELCDLADERGVTLQVGHIERFNPAIEAVASVLADEEILAFDARRLGAPRERDIKDGAVMDLMIHDIDVVCSLVDDEIDLVNAVSTEDGRYVDAQLGFSGGTVGSLTASRVTQRKIRELTITARDCWIVVDYIHRSIDVHRQSPPEPDDAPYTEFRSGVWRRGIDSNEGIIEQPVVGDGEPLKKEVASFVECARTGREPVVSAADGLRALRIAKRIDRLADPNPIEADPR
ncbi:Gfo/Idh/MocA family protein [Halococcus hamelinensis]|uniref:Oxidoreductase domain-containing protein n=1 Tax=Halococcus hamelinensis 100A6 TaxID=1132509 RepID=M0LTM9_9EURY|nr:Gfo/Idh/MocA family oxidoreductase [Halococcus hamelinensis]EMA35759.1 oxidoreductase domain-containing protein [Halococcus hamelinensis 100A6]